jgi:2-dehydropantoate 2-reductase
MYGGRGAVVVGELDGRRTARIEEIHRLLGEFDADAVLSDNVWGYLWSKLIYGALLFATALTDESIADVLDARRYRPALSALGREVAAVAAAEQIRLEAFNGFDPAAFVAGADAAAIERSFSDMVAFNRRSAKTHSGIWRDLAVRRRRTEVDALIAPSVEIGRSRGLATPLCARLVELIHDLENGRRRQDWAALDELVAVHEAARGEGGAA